MDTSLTVKTMRRQSWALMVQEQVKSGLTINEWCAQNGISPKAFYYRRKQVQAMILDEMQPPVFAELKPHEPIQSSIEKSVSESMEFVPQLVMSVEGALIGVNQSTPKQLVSDMLEVLRHA